jgi:hypothetical protein
MAMEVFCFGIGVSTVKMAKGITVSWLPSVIEAFKTVFLGLCEVDVG